MPTKKNNNNKKTEKQLYIQKQNIAMQLWNNSVECW